MQQTPNKYGDQPKKKKQREKRKLSLISNSVTRNQSRFHRVSIASNNSVAKLCIRLITAKKKKTWNEW